MRALLCKVGQMPIEVDIPNKLEMLQQIVGGYIETIDYPDLNAAIVLDEEGKLKGKEANAPVYNLDLTKEGYINIIPTGDYIAGDFLVVGTGDEDFDDLPDISIAIFYQLYEGDADEEDIDDGDYEV